MKKFDIYFEMDGDEYSGEVAIVSERSFRVVINQQMFGVFDFNGNEWQLAGEPGNPILVKAVIKAVDDKIIRLK